MKKVFQVGIQKLKVGFIGVFKFPWEKIKINTNLIPILFTFP